MARILIVEDEVLLSSIISRELTNAGHEVHAAYDGENALKEVDSTKPELILLDLIMPKMNGFQLLDSLKKNPDTASIPVIVLSNLGQKEEIEKAKLGGAIDYMVKIDFAPKDVRNRVNEIIESYGTLEAV